VEYNVFPLRGPKPDRSRLMNKDALVDKLARLVEAGGTPRATLREELVADLESLVAAERRRFRTTSVVAMSEEDAVRYRAISELASDWVYAVRVDENANLNLEWATGAFADVTGYRVDEVNEMGGWSKLLRSGADAYTAASELMAGHPSTLEYRIVTRAGDELWLRDYACPELDATGERVVRLFGAIKNVTEEVAAREALREAKQRLEQRVGFEETRFRAVLDQAGESIFMIDFATGGFIDVNETACRILGYSREELLMMSIGDIEADPPDWFSRVKLGDFKANVPTERYHVRKDGTKFPVELALSRRRYIGQDYILAVAREITERKEMEIQLAQADRLASVGVLAAGVAHEINNPLVYILNNVSYALSELPESFSELRSALREARSGAERVRDIVKDLKTFARSDERMGPTDVTALVDSAVKVAENEFKFRARIVREYSEDLPMVEANSRLGQVFLNLLLNAAHAIREGDPDKNTITIGARRDGDRVVVSVRDTGSGIEPEKLKKIFDPFFTTKPVGMGTGLGLSICRNIVHALSGEIHVQSEEGMGSTFSVYLPALEQNKAMAIQAPSTVPPPVAAARALEVLVVDDDAFVARAIRRLLRPRHAVTLAAGGAQALECLARAKFDIIFCDVMMPNMTGMELHQEVKRRYPEMADRFVFITGGPFTPEARELFDQVTNPCIQKPFTPADLANVLESHCFQRESLEQMVSSLKSSVG
jgi:PAS domain S-box-containing protein